MLSLKEFQITATMHRKKEVAFLNSFVREVNPALKYRGWQNLARHGAPLQRSFISQLLATQIEIQCILFKKSIKLDLKTRTNTARDLQGTLKDKMDCFGGKYSEWLLIFKKEGKPRSEFHTTLSVTHGTHCIPFIPHSKGHCRRPVYSTDYHPQQVLLDM